ncbi:MAG: DUF502 domain-containing protein [Micavibrio sp.]
MSDPKIIPLSPKEHFHRSVFAKLRGYFLAGILVTAPVSITLYLTWGLLKFIDSKVSSVIPAEYYRETAVPGLGLIIAIAFFIVVGWFAKNFLGRMIIQTSEYILDKMPVIRTVYGATKQIFETVMGAQSQAFREVVMFEFPRKGIWALGFVTGVAKGEVQRLTEDEVVNVFFPTTPNPTSGFLLFIPKKDLVLMEMTVEEAIKMIVSGGILTPPDPVEIS